MNGPRVRSVETGDDYIQSVSNKASLAALRLYNYFFMIAIVAIGNKYDDGGDGESSSKNRHESVVRAAFASPTSDFTCVTVGLTPLNRAAVG